MTRFIEALLILLIIFGAVMVVEAIDYNTPSYRCIDDSESKWNTYGEEKIA